MISIQNSALTEQSKPVLFDTEYDNINAWEATKIWCISCIDLTTLERRSFHPKEEGEGYYHKDFEKDFKEYLKGFNCFVGQNFIGAEAVVLERLLGIKIPLEQIVDTLVLSRLFRPKTPEFESFNDLKKRGLDNRLGGHSIDAWGTRLGRKKIDFKEFSRFSWQMLEYNKEDVEINLLQLQELVKEQEEYEFSEESIHIEHYSHKILTDTTINGFCLDKPIAAQMLKETAELLEEATVELRKAFPDKKKLTNVYRPRYKKDGQMSEPSRKKLMNSINEKNFDGTYNIYKIEEFNPGSPKQVGERLIDFGWNPKKFTPKGQPAVDKATLEEAIDAMAQEIPEIENLRKYSIYKHRHIMAREWLELSNNSKDGRIHGTIFHIGPWTHRSSHNNPNMGNIAKIKTDAKGTPLKGVLGDFGWDSRRCWIAEQGKVLVGVDATGIQLRALAHYIDDKEFTTVLCSGDIHSFNQKAAGIEKGYLGMSPRDVAKRFIYAWLLGAGDEKVGIIVGVDKSEYQDLFMKAKKIRKWKGSLLTWIMYKLRKENRLADEKTVATILKGHFTKKKFLDSLPALKTFKEKRVKNDAEQGFVIGLDGRKIWTPNEHFAMGAFLQGFESVVMKWAMKIWHEELKALNIPFKLVAYVHDEWVVECFPEHAEKVLEVVKSSIPKAGELLKTACPLASAGATGKAWSDIH